MLMFIYWDVKIMLSEGTIKAVHEDSEKVLWICDKVNIFGNNTNRSKLYSWRDQEQTKFGECLLPFGSEYFIISPAGPRNGKVKIYKTVNLPLVFTGVKLGLSH
jgi:hypothetical protein